ncbi:LuxR C-terminal-related transcriptional regulator [Streptomyces sp. V3I7]|uniref:LuxR C-terminal-related transcriptional regulator n=1 Tax=Streptomyces sp. V3I7 TaxID=3042278 RepID=UPI002785148B|nr:LuxR C-terminal-related transcriptional regulator [Streptomyces sp. V3I7]MDQ0994482.1 DNA-binding CsgD family transcriptional regulator [Streptomyces sp. V3I7]
MTGHADGRQTAGTYLASTAPHVSAEIRESLRHAEAIGLRGDPDGALRRLTALPVDGSGEREQDLVAVADLAALLMRWGGDGALARRICDRAIERATEPAVRAKLLLARARASESGEAERFQVRALGEFTAAGDARGRALALGRMAFPTDSAEDPANEHRARLGREGLELALRTGDSYVIALCAGHLAVCETYLGRKGALRRWREVVALLPLGLDASTAEMAATHHINWAITAAAFGDYEQAQRALREGRSTAYASSWIRTFDAIQAWALVRAGELDRAAAQAALIGAGPRQWASAVAEMVAVACAFERSGRLPAVAGDDALALVAAAGCHELGHWWLALGARIRAARAEPSPCRDLLPALAEVRRKRLRFGWEDVLLALAEIDPHLAAPEAAAMAKLWPAGPRGRAIRLFVTGLTTRRGGHEPLRQAAERLAALPEPITAGRAFHAAARQAPTVAEGNALRVRAIELLESAGAERSLAAVVRDRRLHRGPDRVRVPESQRHQLHAGLTPREHEVAVLAARGLTAQEIADTLGISLGTARNHLLSVRGKFGGIPKRRLARLLSDERTAGERYGR